VANCLSYIEEARCLKVKLIYVNSLSLHHDLSTCVDQLPRYLQLKQDSMSSSNSDFMDSASDSGCSIFYCCLSSVVV